jgi:hypothetical protein
MSLSERRLGELCHRLYDTLEGRVIETDDGPWLVHVSGIHVGHGRVSLLLALIGLIASDSYSLWLHMDADATEGDVIDTVAAWLQAPARSDGASVAVHAPSRSLRR